MKKILAFVTAVVLIMSLASCVKSDEELILGSWTTELDVTEVFNEMFAKEEATKGYFNISEFKLGVTMTFKDDGTYEMTIDEESFDKSMEALREDLVDGFTDYIADTAHKAGITSEAFLKLMGHSSVYQFVDSIFTEDMINDALEEFKASGKYLLKDGKIFTTSDIDEEIDEDEYETYELSANELKFTDHFGDDEEGSEIMKKMYPIVWERAN